MYTLIQRYVSPTTIYYVPVGEKDTRRFKGIPMGEPVLVGAYAAITLEETEHPYYEWTPNTEIASALAVGAIVYVEGRGRITRQADLYYPPTPVAI